MIDHDPTMTASPRPFRRILIANRGEIALRVIRTAHRMGYATVAVFSDADAGAPHVLAADEAVRIGPAPAQASYLATAAILDAARRTGADALHPGYGFLSESPDFARACEEAGLVFIGPPPGPIALMGNKREAKARLEAAGVPCVPGYNGSDQSPQTMAARAGEIGYPVMVKAAAGGGGRGMRLVERPERLEEALPAARSEAESAFGNGELLLEKALSNPRHVEIQVLADHHGAIVHLGERDCSVQRRHQKVIEEAPSPAVSPELRSRMGQAAVEACRAIGYRNAGTVEFLLDTQGAFHFLEMNTRLQVEHPVTEMVLGLDLVEWQLRIAAGEALPFTQDALQPRGHAIEARLYAEDPARGSLPATGTVRWLELPQGERVRVDHGLAPGLAIGAHYDPMLAKVIAAGETREDARRRLARALRELVVLGVGHNRELLLRILHHADFVSGAAATGFLPAEFPEAVSLPGTTPPGGEPPFAAGLSPLLALAAVACLHRDGWTPGPAAPGAGHALAPPPVTVRLRQTAGYGGPGATVGAGERELTVAPLGGGGYRVREGDEEITLRVHHRRGARWRVEANGVHSTAFVITGEDGPSLDWNGGCGQFSEITTGRAAMGQDSMDGRVCAPATGKVLRVLCRPGDRIEAGQCLLVLEAMKLEHEVRAPMTGTVRALSTAEGRQVAMGAPLLELETPAVPEEG